MFLNKLMKQLSLMTCNMYIDRLTVGLLSVMSLKQHWLFQKPTIKSAEGSKREWPHLAHIPSSKQTAAKCQINHILDQESWNTHTRSHHMICFFFQFNFCLSSSVCFTFISSPRLAFPLPSASSSFSVFTGWEFLFEAPLRLLATMLCSQNGCCDLSCVSDRYTSIKAFQFSQHWHQGVCLHSNK